MMIDPQNLIIISFQYFILSSLAEEHLRKTFLTPFLDGFVHYIITGEFGNSMNNNIVAISNYFSLIFCNAFLATCTLRKKVGPIFCSKIGAKIVNS